MKADQVIASARKWWGDHPSCTEIGDLIALAEHQARHIAALSRKVTIEAQGTASSRTISTRDTEARRRLRKQLVAEGCDEVLIATAIEKLRWDQLVARHGAEQAAQILYANAPQQPDDTGYKPSHVPAELTGAGRATGDTARAVKRGHTLAKWETEVTDG